MPATISRAICRTRQSDVICLPTQFRDLDLPTARTPAPIRCIEATSLFTTRSFEHFRRHAKCHRSRHRFCLCRRPDNDAGAIQELKNVAISWRRKFFRGAKTRPNWKMLCRTPSARSSRRLSPSRRRSCRPRAPAGNTRAYLASFQSNPSRPFWRGFLKGLYPGRQRSDPGGCRWIPLASSMAWDAGQVLSTTSASSRTI